MRRRFAIPLIVVVALTPIYWFRPAGPAPGLPARYDAHVDIEADDHRIGGLSGIEVTADGASFLAIGDRGHVVQGALDRENGTLTAVRLAEVRPYLDKNGLERDFPHTDAEGVAVDDKGRVFVSFEHAHRILRYDDWDSPARWPSYTKAWRAMSKNKGMEALAISDDGTLFTLPEQVNKGASDNLVYRRKPTRKWEQPFTLPVDQEFRPVGADFGPDGRLYLLERGMYYFLFHSRIRAMTVTETGVEDIEVVMQSPLGRHGNLEGLSVWADAEGNLRLTMVSDDNFQFFLPQQIVEYVLPSGVAKAKQ